MDANEGTACPIICADCGKTIQSSSMVLVDNVLICTICADIRWTKYQAKGKETDSQFQRFVCAQDTCNRSFYTYHAPEVTCCPYCGGKVLNFETDGFQYRLVRDHG